MSKQQDILLPDIGDFDTVDVIEIAVNEGDKVAKEDTLLTLESDKATMDIPSPSAGIIQSIEVSVGDKVAEGTLIAVIESADEHAQDKNETTTTVETVEQPPNAANEPPAPTQESLRPAPQVLETSEVVGASQSARAQSPGLRRCKPCQYSSKRHMSRK